MGTTLEGGVERRRRGRRRRAVSVPPHHLRALAGGQGAQDHR
ncbi:hypothetical protein [Kitasatospora aureofaciens]|nr:hypothetical protein [Kitasatospora aureofaciens]